MFPFSHQSLFRLPFKSVFKPALPVCRNWRAWHRPAVPVAGLEIGLRHLRLADLTLHADRAHELRHYASQPLAATVMHGGHAGIDDLDQLIDAVRQLWNRADIPARRLAIGIPETMSYTTIHTLHTHIPPDDEMQLQAIALAQSEHMLPYPSSEASIDFCLLPPVQHGTAMQLFIAVTRQDIVDDLCALSEALQLELLAIDLNPYAEYAAWQHRQHTSAGRENMADNMQSDHAGSKFTAFLNLTDDGLQGRCFDGPLLRTDLSRSLAFSPSRQGQTRDSEALPPAALLHCQHFLQDWLHQFQRDSSSSVPVHIVLTGNHASMPELAAAISQHPGCAVSIAAPFDDMHRSAAADDIAWSLQAPAYLAAYGLCLRATGSACA